MCVSRALVSQIYLISVDKVSIWSWQEIITLLVYQVEECDLSFSQEPGIWSIKDW